MSKKFKKSLPELPSDVILTALDDLKLVEKDERFTVNMRTFYAPRHGRTADGEPICAVCLGGAAIVKTIGVPGDSSGFEMHEMLSKHDLQRVLSLDDFRVGYMRLGLSTIGEKYRKIWDKSGREDYVAVPTYSVNPSGFKLALRKMAADLKKIGA